MSSTGGPGGRGWRLSKAREKEAKVELVTDSSDDGSDQADEKSELGEHQLDEKLTLAKLDDEMFESTVATNLSPNRDAKAALADTDPASLVTGAGSSANDMSSFGLPTSANVADLTTIGAMASLPRQDTGTKLPPGATDPNDLSLISAGSVMPPGSVGGNPTPVTMVGREHSSDANGNSQVTVKYEAGFEAESPTVKGTTTTTTYPDGTTSTLIEEIHDGGATSIVARDDGTTRTETKVNTDGTVMGSTSTTRATDSLGVTTDTTTYRGADGHVSATTTVATDPLGITTTTHFDAAGNATSTSATDSDGNTVSGASEPGDYPTDNNDGADDSSGSGDDSDDDSDDSSDDDSDDSSDDSSDGGDDGDTETVYVNPDADTGVFEGHTRVDDFTFAGLTAVDERFTNTGSPDDPGFPIIDGPVDEPSTPGDETPQVDDFGGLVTPRLDPGNIDFGRPDVVVGGPGIDGDPVVEPSNEFHAHTAFSAEPTQFQLAAPLTGDVGTGLDAQLEVASLSPEFDAGLDVGGVREFDGEAAFDGGGGIDLDGDGVPG